LRPFAALLLGNVALAFGPLWVRLADCGPVSAGFWRLTLALVPLALLARGQRQGEGQGEGRGQNQPIFAGSRLQFMVMAGAGVFFALDLAAWHLGIARTRLGNATLFGNSGSVIVMAWGLFAVRRWPHRGEWIALAAAALGATILFGRSLEISAASLTGDLLCVLAGVFYAFYILMLRSMRAHLGNWSLLLGSTLTGAPLLLVVAIALGEPVWPQAGPGAWWPVVVLSLSSQVLGQGLLVYALRHFSPLVIGLVLLTQPAIAVSIGAVVFGETLTATDALGMVMVAAALAIVRATERGAPREEPAEG
jgi:drug/metabolite transporter (DMT)-like permease